MPKSMTVSEINQKALCPETFVAQCHEGFTEQALSLAEYIRANNLHYVYISGPTSSGKTTFANTLRHYMENREVVPISLDDFFRPQSQLKRKKDGSKDYESIRTIDLPKLQRVMKKLQSGKAVSLPHFDFKKHRVVNNHTHLMPGKDTIYIIEGLHALNGKICKLTPAEDSVKVYVAPAGQVIGENGTVLNKNDFRFIRRMIRDNYHRSAPPEVTFEMWKNVRLGEKRYSYGKQADFRIDTFLFCEPCILKEEGLALLRSMKNPGRKAKRLMGLLQQFTPISPALLPATSILQEFLDLDIEK